MKLSSDYRIHKTRGHRIVKCKECERAYQRQVYERNAAAIRERKRVAMAHRRAADPDAYRESRRIDYLENRDARRATIKGYAKKRFFWTRARRLDAVTAKDLASMWKRQRGICALTGVRLDRTAEVDHIVPKARSGDDSLANLRWVSAAANRAKRDLTDEEFLALCESVTAFLGRRIAAYFNGELIRGLC
jgi:5-methylcytosine-specific restriction endonuclease McrA